MRPSREDDLIYRQDAIDLVRDVCDAVMSMCESWYDPETEDEVYKDIREVDAILKCNKEVRIALQNMPSAQPEKEKPTHVLMSEWRGHRYARYTCPNCGKPVRNDDIYCHRCGQRIMFPKIDFAPYEKGKTQQVIITWEDE